MHANDTEQISAAEIAEQECSVRAWEQGSGNGGGEIEDERRLQIQTLNRLLSAQLLLADYAKDLGRALLVVGYQAHLEGCTIRGAPTSLRELSRRMGVTKGRASQIVSKLNSENRYGTRGFIGFFTQCEILD